MLAAARLLLLLLDCEDPGRGSVVCDPLALELNILPSAIRDRDRDAKAERRDVVDAEAGLGDAARNPVPVPAPGVSGREASVDVERA